MLIRPRDFADLTPYLWVERPDARQHLDGMKSRRNRVLLEHFIAQGYAVTADCIPKTDIAEFLRELEIRLEDPEHAIMMTYRTPDGKRHEAARRVNLDKPSAKVLDVHAKLPSSQKLIFNPALLAFLRDVFDDEPVAFQTLYFEYGSQQDAHQDTAFVPVDPPFQLVASWIALEDVTVDSGELFFYPHSHTIGDVRFANGSKAFDVEDPEAPMYSSYLEDLAYLHGLERRRFQPKRGAVLYWINDLIHGGEAIEVWTTRRSLVTHYCPLGATIPWARDAGKHPVAIPTGGYILSGT